MNATTAKTPREQFLLDCRRQFHDHLRDKGLVGYMRNIDKAPVGIMIAKENREDGHVYLGWSKVNTKSTDRWNKYEGLHHALTRLVPFAKIGTKIEDYYMLYKEIGALCSYYGWRPDVCTPLFYMATRALTYYKGDFVHECH